MSPRQLALQVEERVVLPLELRPLRDGCAVNHCPETPSAVLALNSRPRVCEEHKRAYMAQGIKVFA